MQIFDIAIAVLLVYGCLKKGLGYSNLLGYEKEGAQVYKNQSIKLKIFQYTSLALSIVSAIYFAYIVFANGVKFNVTMVNTFLFLFYLGFLPTSSGYWALTKKGIYFYLHDRYIRWPEVINTGIEHTKKNNEKSDYFLTLIVKKQKSEIFKQTQYRCIVPAADIEMIQEFIATERKKVDRIMLKRKSGSYREELKKTGRRS